MKTILFLACSIDGQIARSDDSVSWGDDVWRNYYEFCNEVGALLVGRRTYELMAQSPELTHLKLQTLGIVTQTLASPPSRTALFPSHRAALQHCQAAGYQRVVIGGGTTLAHSLLEDDLLDEVQLDIEPKIYGAGIPMFRRIDQERGLELLETRKSGAHTVRVHYRIKKRG